MMKIVTINTVLTFYVILLSSIICNAFASCPCHIPCTGELEICTCYGECGDDGYGCSSHGNDYGFFNQVKCQEDKWQVQCKRQSKCKANILDDKTPFSAYKQLSEKLTLNDYDNSELSSSLSSAHSMSWFGGNWFDFFGSNQEQFFINDIDDKFSKLNDKTNQDDSISIDNKADDTFNEPEYIPSNPSQRSLKTAQSVKKHTINDALGHNAAGYEIIALPLYILIGCIISAAIFGMLLCAGFVYCGLNYCCPLPPTSPTMTSSQRSTIRELASLTLGKRYKSDSEVGGLGGIGGIYHRMQLNALHNPTNDEMDVRSNKSGSLSPLGITAITPLSMRNNNNNHDNNDEYIDSEDEQKQHSIFDTPQDFDNDYDEEYKKLKEKNIAYLMQGECDSDIDNDSVDQDIISQYSELITKSCLKPHQNIEIMNNEQEEDEEEENNENNEENTENSGSSMDIDVSQSKNINDVEKEEEEEEEEDIDDSLSDLSGNEHNNNNMIVYEENDELQPLKGNLMKHNHNNNHIEIENDEDMLDLNGLVTVEQDEDDDEEEEDDEEIVPFITVDNNDNINEKNNNLP